MDERMLSCRDCGAMISRNSDHCPKCGAPNYVKREKIALITGIGNLILAIIFIIFFVNRHKCTKAILNRLLPHARTAAQIRT